VSFTGDNLGMRRILRAALWTMLFLGGGLLPSCLDPRTPSTRPADQAPQSGPFHGEWMQNGEVVLKITHIPGRPIRLERPPNEAWRFEFENIRLQGKMLRFEECIYIKEGMHPFSNTRCFTVLWPNELDRDVLTEVVAVVSAGITEYMKHTLSEITSTPGITSEQVAALVGATDGLQDHYTSTLRRRPTEDPIYMVAEGYAREWADMDSFPPVEHICYFRDHFPRTHIILEDRLTHEDASVRTAVAYVIESIGPPARSLVEPVVAALAQEADPHVRCNLIDALRAVGDARLAVLEAIRQRATPLSSHEKKIDEAVKFLVGVLADKRTAADSSPGDLESEYEDMQDALHKHLSLVNREQERIHASTALYVLSPDPAERQRCLDVIRSWLKPPDPSLTPQDKEDHWDICCSAIFAARDMQDGAQFVPLLEGLIARNDAPRWIPMHAQDTVNVLRGDQTDGQ